METSRYFLRTGASYPNYPMDITLRLMACNSDRILKDLSPSCGPIIVFSLFNVIFLKDKRR